MNSDKKMPGQQNPQQGQSGSNPQEQQRQQQGRDQQQKKPGQQQGDMQRDPNKPSPQQ